VKGVRLVAVIDTALQCKMNNGEQKQPLTVNRLCIG